MSAKTDSNAQYFDYKENIRDIGYIQDQGYLIVVNHIHNQWKVTTVSENIVQAKWVDTADPTSLLGKNINDLFDPLSAYAIISMIERSAHASLLNITSGISQARNFQLLRMRCKDESEELLCCSIVATADRETFILEIEGVEDIAYNMSIPNNRILQSGELVGRIRSCNSIASITSTFCDSVMEVIKGYDRGMVYRFGDDGSGEVIYEKVRDGRVVSSSYLHLRFPAEDIPQQARTMYLKNGIRFVYSVDGADSKLISDGSKVDLTMSSLRAVSKCHIQYLKNMRVISTLAIAIIIEGYLWGLYTFHSYTNPTKPNVEERIVLEMMGSISSMRIHACINEVNTNRKLELGKIMLSLPNMTNVHEFLQQYYLNILAIVDAHTIILFHDHENHSIFGDHSIIPTEEGYRKLCSLSKTNILLHLKSFSEGLNGDGAGVLFYHHQYVTIAFIRRSKVSDVRWGGQPDIPRDPKSAGRLQPRSSFLLYIEQGKKESRQWQTVDMELAQYAIDRITQYLHTELLTSFRLSLDQSNTECLEAIQSAKDNYEFFAHMSHELRTPFHGVISSLQILNSSGNSVGTQERKEIIESALECGKTMLRTLDDILTIAKSKNAADVVSAPFSIAKVVHGTKQIMKPIAEHKLIKFESRIGKLSVNKKILTEIEFKTLSLVGDEIRLGQLANNLTNNAIKFTPAEGSVRTTVHLLSSHGDVKQLWEMERSRYDHSHLVSGYDGRPSPTIPVNPSQVISNVTNLHPNHSDVFNVWFVFEVEDTGCGVKGDDLSAMFEAYKQLSSGVTKTFQGTGLGLHICKLHVDALNGEIGVASTDGKGTLFLFAIPMQLFDTSTKMDAISPLAMAIQSQPSVSSTVPSYPSVPYPQAMSPNPSTASLQAVELKEKIPSADGAIYVVVSDLVMSSFVSLMAPPSSCGVPRNWAAPQVNGVGTIIMYLDRHYHNVFVVGG